MSEKLSKRERNRIKAMKSTKKKLFITLMSMMGALALMAVGAFASATSFDATISNNINVEVNFVEGTLTASRAGGVNAGTTTPAATIADLVLYKTVPESSEKEQEYRTNIENLNATDVNVNENNNTITYVFHFVRDEGAVGNTYITLTELSDELLTGNNNITLNYKYNYGNSEAVLEDVSAIVLENNDLITVNAEHPEVFILCELVADTSTTINVKEKVWSFSLDFNAVILPLPAPQVANIAEDILTFDEVLGAEEYHVYAVEEVEEESDPTSLKKSTLISDNKDDLIVKRTDFEVGQTYANGKLIAVTSDTSIDLFCNEELLEEFAEEEDQKEFTIKVAAVQFGVVGNIKDVGQYTLEICTKMVLNFTSDSYKEPTLQFSTSSAYTIDWGDGSSSISSKTHTYASTGVDYIVKIKVNGSYSLYGYESGSDSTYTVYSCIGLIQNYKTYTPYYQTLRSFTCNDNNLNGIEDYVFYGCTGLTSVTIPSSVTTIGSYAFQYCSSLTSITIPSSVTTIGSFAFYYCRGLTSITIPASVTTIGNDAFEYCRGLTSITIGGSVTTIGSYAFNNCRGLTSITIPEGVTTIGDCAFSSCSSLESITVDVNNQAYSSQDNCLLNKDKTTLIIGCKNSAIPNSVTTIKYYAFYYCSGLTSITIPASVTTIGSYAFGNFSGLESITIPSSVTTIGRYAFSGCSNLASVNFENNLNWYVTETKGATSGTDVTLLVTDDGSENANKLKTTYSDYFWYKRTV